MLSEEFKTKLKNRTLTDGDYDREIARIKLERLRAGLRGMIAFAESL